MLLLLILQEITQASNIPPISWYAIVLTGMLTFLGFMLRDAYHSLKKRIANSEEAIEDLTAKLEGERLATEKALRALDARINELHVNILNRLDDIKDKFNEFRK